VLATGQVGQPEDIAATALFLASDAARQLTGQTIVVDGGWVIHSPIPQDHPENPAFSSQLR
jgi:NAD(P)-dependent dehydrogenase (short-subunit alcohol dehydrogenase family)